MNNLLTTLAVAAFSLLAFPATASAWECLTESCPRQCDFPLTYAIGDLPADVLEADGIAAIQRAFDDWNEPTCVDLQFEYVGRAADLTAPAAIVVGVIPWSDQFGGSSSWTVAFTTAAADGCLTPSMDPNIGLNDENFTWSTDGSADFTTTIDLYTVVLGRIGSMLGIANSFMAAVSVVTATNTEVVDGIGPRDEDAVCWLYADGDVAPTNAAGEVPDHCTLCDADTDCATGEVCLPLFGTQNSSVCIKQCGDDDTSCPGDGECYEVTGLDGMHCFAVTEDTSSATCPNPDAVPQNPDMGGSEPDMGAAEQDMGGPGPAEDMGTSDGSDVGRANDADQTGGVDDNVGGGGCSCGTTSGDPINAAWLLMISLIIRRRRRAS